jgi:hypothetical protein
VSPVLRIRSGAPPADVATTDAGVILAELLLPSDWMLPAAGGSKAKSGTWQDLAANAAGIAGHFRIYNASDVAKMQGVITIAGGGGDMTLDNTNITLNQTVTVTGFTLTDGNG